MDAQIYSNPRQLISHLKTTLGLKKLFEKRVRHYTIEDHAYFVLQQFETYFSGCFEHAICNINLFRLFLALHDIGKPIAFAKGDKSDQYQFTVQILKELDGRVPIKINEINLICSLVGDDPLGLYMQGKMEVAQTAAMVRSMSLRSGLDTKIFFRMMTIYYQCDTASYTKDVGGIPFLEKLFVYHNGKKLFSPHKYRLVFSPKYENRFKNLEKLLTK